MVKLDCILRMRYNIAHGLVTAAQNSPNALKSSQGMPWREAASVILVSPKPLKQSDCSTNSSTGNSSTVESQGKSESKPHFLVTNRSKTGSFSSITCFPGGNVCNADQNEKWIDRFGIVSLQDISKGVTFIKDGGELPSIYHVARDKDPDKLTLLDLEQKRVPKNISLRLTAIRETFEETGILLCKVGDIKKFGKLGQDSASGVGCEATVHNFEDPNEVTYWQERVKNDPTEFMTMCEELICYPDVNALVEWSDWLTPNCFGMQRYDTIFYMALLPQPYPLQICPKEVDSASWMSAEQVLKDCEERKCKMITPQIYELARLRSASIKKLSQLMKIRLKLGIERWCSAYVRAKDGYLSVLPGDDLYPEAMRIELFEPIPSIDSTLDELRDTTDRHHRIEYRSEFDFRVVINNYRERAGHIYLDI